MSYIKIRTKIQFKILSRWMIYNIDRSHAGAEHVTVHAVLQTLEYIDDSLPQESPTAFGMHPNAGIGFRLRETDSFAEQLKRLQPRSAGGGSGTTVEEKAKLVRLWSNPKPYENLNPKPQAELSDGEGYCVSECAAGEAVAPDAEVRMYLVYLKYWTLNLTPLMVYTKVLFHLNISIKGGGLCVCCATASLCV